MATITVDDTMVGQVLASDGILTGIKATNHSGDYRSNFTLVNEYNGFEKTLYNVDPSTMVMTEITDDTFYFKNLIATRVPTGSTWELVTADPPTLTSLNPNTAVSGDPDFTLSCIGANFNPKCVIIFGNEDEPTTLVSDTEVTTGVKPSLFAPAIVPVKIALGDFLTDSIDFTFTAEKEVEPEPPPVPTLTSMTPTSVAAGAGDMALNCSGTNFDATSVIVVGGADIQTNFGSPTAVAGLLKPSEFEEGVYEVQVRVGTNLTNSLDFTFTAPE